MNRRCDHCHRELRADGPLLNYCGVECRREYHTRLTRSMPERRRPEPQRQPVPGEAALLADRAAGSRATTSVSAGWTAVANQAGTYRPFFDKYEPSRGNL